MHPIPQILLDELSEIPSFNEEEFVAAHAHPSVFSIRLNPLKPSLAQQENISAQVPWCKDGRYLIERPFFTHDPLLHAGAYYVQEASSMFIAEIIEQQKLEPHSKVLDLCAAPGGKTTLLASLFPKGLIVSNEVIKTRASILVENVTKWGTPNVVVSHNDPKQFAQLVDFFDVMLIDAPCSGSGLFRREPDWKEGWTSDNVTLCGQRQQRILADAWPALRADGLLIYATCSYSKAEDEEIIEWIVNNLDAEPVQIALRPDWHIVETIGNGFGYRFFPDKVQGEGFFVTVFRKKSSHSANYWISGKLPLATSKETEQLNGWINPSEELTYFKQADNILAIPSYWQDTVASLQQQLYLRKAGITLGQLKAKGFVPAHDLAISTIKNADIQAIELNLQQALFYLKHQQFNWDNPDNYKGWTLVTYQNIGLGWIKTMPNRYNNYYPIDWRILKD